MALNLEKVGLATKLANVEKLQETTGALRRPTGIHGELAVKEQMLHYILVFYVKCGVNTCLSIYSKFCIILTIHGSKSTLKFISISCSRQKEKACIFHKI